MKTINLRTSIFIFLIGAITFSISSCTEDDPIITLPTFDVLDCGYFNDGTNRTLTDDPDKAVDYIIDCRAFVSVDLVIEPGVVIEFKDGAGLEIGENGSISAKGTADKPIILTGETKNPGSWAGLLVDSESTKNELEYVTISYGGGTAFNSNDNKANLILWAETDIAINNSTFSNSETHGIDFTYNDINLRSFENNTLTENQTAAMINAEYMHKMKANNDFTGNVNDFVQVITSDIPEGNITWANINVPYQVAACCFGIFRNITIVNGSNVEVEAGTTINFETDCGIYIHDGGSFKISGTADKKVTLSGVDGAAGAWRGLDYNFTQSVRNTIDYAVIQYAGSGDNNAAIYMWADPKVTVTNSEFLDIDGCVFTDPGQSFDNPNFSESGNTFTNTTSTFCN